MNPKYRGAILLGMTSLVMAPYVAFILHYSRQFPPNQWPPWFTNTIAIWFIANFLVVMLLVRLAQRIFKPKAVDIEKARAVSEKSLRTGTRLLVLWIAFFIYGVIEAVQGTVSLRRAIPAGAFLLFFIGLFGWSIYRAKRAKKSEPTSLT